MNKQELIQAYTTMPEASLLGIIKREQREVLEIEVAIVEDWIKNEKCEF